MRWASGAIERRVRREGHPPAQRRSRYAASASGGVRLPEQVVHQLLVAPRHELGLARAAGAYDVETHRAHPGVQGAAYVRALVVADVKDLLRREAERLDRGAEDLRARLGVPDVHRVDRRGEEVARAVLLEQPVLGAPGSEAGIADDGEHEMAA